MRAAIPETHLKGISCFLFDGGYRLTRPISMFPDVLVGFAQLDAQPLVPSSSSGSRSVQRSFVSELRLLEAPAAPSSLEVDVRVWPSVGSNAQTSAVSDGVSGMDWHGLPVVGHHAAEPNGSENKENGSSGAQAIASAGMLKS